MALRTRSAASMDARPLHLSEIAKSFMKDFFFNTAHMSWSRVLQEAVKFLPALEASWSPLVQEMRGLADGAGLQFEDILALNVRTEIAYGMFNDGCTAFSWKKDAASFLAQNWDWDKRQRSNLISITIVQDGKPSIQMITEAGIIGKIGMNSAGVGVTLNAIKAKGVDFNKLPCHLALRTALNSSSREDAVNKLEKAGVASACHILVADRTGGVGLECTSLDIVKLPMTGGIVTHTNHFIEPHAGPEAKLFLLDSPFRLQRARELLQGAGSGPTLKNVQEILKDEEHYPAAICRAESEKSPLATLFSIVMDLENRRAEVNIGRPTEPEESLTLQFS